MADGIRWVGLDLDVHAHESTIAVFDQGTGELSTHRVVGRPHQLLERLMDIPVPARMVYEAGLTGYGLARCARARGIEMSVCAPGRTARRPGDRVKTDKRDAVSQIPVKCSSRAESAMFARHGERTAPTQSRTSSSSGRFVGLAGGICREAWYSNG